MTLALFNSGMLPLKLLAVLGGITLGVVATGWLVKLLAKALAFQKVSPFLLRLCRILGGLAVGLLVWSSVFNGEGFLGFGGGGSGLSGQGGGTGTANSDRTEKGPSDQGTPKPEHTLRIHMRGGAEPEKDQRFYVIEGEIEPRTWQDLEPILADRKRNSNFEVIAIIISKGSVDEHNPAVEQLKDWAKKNGVAVK
jgi:hypothetical protein